MVDNLTEMMQREWNSVMGDGNDYNGNSNINHTWHPRSLSRKISDSNGSNNQHQQSPNDVPSMSTVRIPRPLSTRPNLDAAYDTDGALGTSGRTSRNHHHHHHLHSNNNYDYLISPRLSVRRHLPQSSKQMVNAPKLQQRLLHKVQLGANPSLAPIHDHDDREDDPNYDDDAHRRHIRLSRRGHQPANVGANHGARINHPVATLQHSRLLAASPTVQPLRIIFMRHGERVNQALGPDWFMKAFRANIYRPYDENLPDTLPKRRFDQAYEFDVPLTVRGLKTARLTGRALLNNGYVADICLSSTALRCVQTCERTLTGMDRRERIPIRIEPGLFECPHLNHKITDSFMTKRELMENTYNIKHEYKALIPRVSVPETLDDYFDRSAAVMRGIISRYGRYGGTVLIVTHAPGLLALTDAIKGARPNAETFYRTVSTYPPLATCIAEYDGSKWRFTEQPFTLVPS